MRDLEKHTLYGRAYEKQKARRQFWASVGVLLLVVGLGVLCVYTYVQMRGGCFQ